MTIDELNEATLLFEQTLSDRCPEISPVEFWLLYDVYRCPNISVVKLADMRNRTFQTVSRVCQNLQARDLMTIEVNPRDSRARIIKLTPKGRRVYFKIAGAVKTSLTTKQAV